MQTVSNVKIVLRGLDEYQEKVKEKAAAFEKAANELAELFPGTLQIDIRTADICKGPDAVKWLKDAGMTFEVAGQKPPEAPPIGEPMPPEATEALPQPVKKRF